VLILCSMFHAFISCISIHFIVSGHFSGPVRATGWFCVCVYIFDLNIWIAGSLWLCLNQFESQHSEENVAKVVSATSSEGILVYC